MGSVTTTAWFDQWVKQAKNRKARRQQIDRIVQAITGALVIAGLFMILIGCAWIDSTDICAANVILSFVGVGFCFTGTYTRFLWEHIY